MNQQVKLVFSLILALSILIFVRLLFQTDTEWTSIKSNNQEERKNGSGSIAFGSDLADLIWMVQVTDLHFSASNGLDGGKAFVNFCTWMETLISPHVVIVTGDLTDGSGQFEQDWMLYKESLNKCHRNFSSASKWIDIRGNHDTYGVANEESQNNLFRNFSVQAFNKKRSFLTKMEISNHTYGFLGVDAALVPGPKKPFNYFGWLSRDELGVVSGLVAKAKLETEHWITFGHYPTSFISTPSPGLRHLLGHSIAYLCGHLHTAKGKVPQMISSQSEGFLEMELSDWAGSRRYRLLALDHGQLAAIDETWTGGQDDVLVMVTNPIDLKFAKSVEAIKNSTHIRILVFSSSKSLVVSAVIDGSLTLNCSRTVTGSPLFTAAWNASAYDDGQVHNIKIKVSNSVGGVTLKQVEVQFSLDEFVAKENFGKFSFLSDVILTYNFVTVLRTCFGLSVLAVILPLILLRFTKASTLKRIIKSEKCIFKCLQPMWVVSKNNKLFLLLTLGPIYCSVGPLAVGHFLNDSGIGVLFSWGLFIEDTLLPSDIVLLYGLICIIPYFYLILFWLCFVIHQMISKQPSKFLTVILNFAFIFILSLQIFHFIDIYNFYGLLEAISVGGIVRIIYVCVIYIVARSNEIQINL